jgi:DnaJ-class molecular chaperone
MLQGKDIRDLANFNEIDEARRLLGLGEAATLREVKSAYRTLAHHHHPDKHSGADGEEIMKRLNAAYKLLTDYCSNYKYSFREKDVARAYPEEEYMRNWRKNWFNSI